MKFHIRTLGCKMNQLDSARLLAALQHAGHSHVASEGEAECVVVNSCTVTARADRKSRQAARAAERSDREVLVLGCGPRSDPQRWRAQLPQSRIFDSETALLAYMDAVPGEALFPITSRTRLPVAIQSGCDDTCAFCITRVARGAHRSRPAEAIIRHIREARALGIKEVVLTGINMAAWGCSNSRYPRQSRLHELLFRVLEQTDVPRVRLSSLGPQYLQPGFFDALSDPRVCDHLHLSVQSGSVAVLRRMGRGHGVEEVYQAAQRARQVRPNLALTADFIVGFPGETDQDFEQTASMAEAIAFAKLHVFPFSPREGTPAATSADQLSIEEKKRRAAFLRELGRRTRRAFVDSQVGSTQDILVERDQTGLTSNYIRVRVPEGQDGEMRTMQVLEHHVADRG